MIRIPLLLFVVLVSDSVCSGQSQEIQKTFQYKPPQFLYEEKCSKCHTLERVFAEPKTDEEGRILLELKSMRDWEKCVADMRNLARQRFKKDWFTSEEFKLIVGLLVKTQGLKESESSVPENINKK
ncbi:MAG: hypothetical protein U0586_11130 [Candidatus Brocadiaceae bacterium]